MVLLDLRVYGLPVSQGRPRARAFRVGAFTRVSMYDPANSKDWKRTVLAQALERKPETPAQDPLSMSLAFLLPRPKSLPKRERHHTKKPDVDNLAKAVKDALRGVVYRDDSQIVELHVTKRYDLAPGVVIRVERVVNQPGLDARWG